MNTRNLIGAGALALALAVAGCGSTSSTSTQSSAGSASSAAPVSITPKGYFDMSLLASDLKSQVDSKQTAGPGVTVTDLTCIQTGSQTAECHATYSDGSEQSVQADISADGQSYITH